MNYVCHSIISVALGNLYMLCVGMCILPELAVEKYMSCTKCASDENLRGRDTHGKSLSICTDGDNLYDFLHTESLKIRVLL